MPTLGDLSTRLILESSRSLQSNPPSLRPYPTPLLSSLFHETRSLSTQIQTAQEIGSTQLGEDEAALCQLLVSALGMRRNKRCLLAFHQQRLDVLEERFWKSGGASGSTTGGGVSALTKNDVEIQRNASPAEIDYLKGYAKLVGDFKSAFVDVLDICGNIERPPKELWVQVRVVKEPKKSSGMEDGERRGGIDVDGENYDGEDDEDEEPMEIETESSGTLTLQLGNLYFVKLPDVERLLASGILEEVAP